MYWVGRTGMILVVTVFENRMLCRYLGLTGRK